MADKSKPKQRRRVPVLASAPSRQRLARFVFPDTTIFRGVKYYLGQGLSPLTLQRTIKAARKLRAQGFKVRLLKIGDGSVAIYTRPQMNKSVGGRLVATLDRAIGGRSFP